MSNELFASIIILVVMGFYGAFFTYHHNRIEDAVEHATIADTQVPVVHCEEDEVITWVQPNTLGCVHIDEVR